jgi:diguanylate cyclase (GGDEF)-like protein
MVVKFFLLGLALLVAPLLAEGPFLSARLAMRSMGVEEGLPNARVHATLRDHHGRLWVGTQEGAAFLGGAGWTVFPLPSDAPSNYIRALAETPDGALWFGTEAGGLWRWKRGAWKHWAGGQELRVNRINALLVDAETVWVGTAGGGLYRIIGDSAVHVPGPADLWIWTIASVPDAAGRRQIWVGGEKQVWLQEQDGWRQLGEKEGWWKAGANAIVTRQLPGGAQEVWVSSWGFGVGVWDPGRQRFNGRIADFPSRNTTSLAICKPPGGGEELWVGTYDSGLFKRTADGWEPLGSGQGFPSTSVYCLLANPEGRPSFWAGTRGAGLVAVDPAGWRSLADDQRIPSRQANCFLETVDPKRGRVFWIGTDKGLVRWDARGPAVETSAQGLPGEFITDLLEVQTPMGPELWASTIGGIARRRGDRWESFGNQPGLTYYRVQCLAADLDDQGRNRIFAGADGGLVIFENGAWRQYGVKDGLPHSIVTSLVASMDKDGTRCLWVGTRGGGLVRLKQGRWKTFGTKEGLPNVSVYGLAASESRNGKRWLWVALLGARGLARLDLDQPERGFRSWDQKELPGLRGQGVQGIIVSGKERLYLTTTSGVVELGLRGQDSDPGRVLTFTPSDGLPSSATSAGNAIYMDREHRIWVGTAKGIAVLDSRSEQQLIEPPSPLVERVSIQGRKIDPELPITLGFRDRRLNVAFSLPVFHRHEAIRYRTQLLGWESEPEEWNDRPFREFTLLPARKYVLRIWALDGLGRETPFKDLAFTIMPPPWSTWWALTLEAGLLGGLAYLVVYRRQRFLEKRTLELEQQVTYRTGELAAANAALHTQSLTDPLTRLWNRRALDESMGELLSRYLRRHLVNPLGPCDDNRDMGFLLLDLDHFKSVNDTYGHRVGDRVLQQAAEILRQVVRDTDRIVRWGGEEFVVVAVDTNLDEIPRLAERLRTAIAEHPFDVALGTPLRLTISVGFTGMPLFYSDPGGVGWEQAVNLADQCLYQAKLSGRNRWVGVLPRPEANLTLEVDLSATSVLAMAEAGLVNLQSGP